MTLPTCFAGVFRFQIRTAAKSFTKACCCGILQKAGAPVDEKLRGKALASYVLAAAKDGYQVAFTLGELDPQFGNSLVLVADTRDGKPLPDKQGPLRLVCSNDKEGARSVRMLESRQGVHLNK